MSESKNLRDGFDSAIPQSTEDVEHALQGGLLSLDANVLLNFYRYTPTARTALSAVFQAAGDRVWVSHQAAREFWRNRFKTIDDRDHAVSQLRSALDKNARASQAAIDGWAKQTAVSDDVRQRVEKAISDGYRVASGLLESEAEEDGTVAYDAARDDVLLALEDLLRSRVGPALAPDDRAAAVHEGNRRAEAGIPPGFRDADKAESGGEDGAAGDYLVWLQSMDEAVRRDLPLVIVTGDEKEDWWWKHRSVHLGPRSELVAEFAQRSDRGLFMLRPRQLIDFASALSVEVPSGAASDVERADAVSSWTREAVDELLARLEWEGKEQAEIIRFAATNGGSIEREKIYELCGYDEDRMLRGFSRPVSRITKDLQKEGMAPVNLPPMLEPRFGGGVIALRYVIPPEVVGLLEGDDSDSDD
ncbi:PIN-like domain-containing protein [Isoptericola sp. 178]|uniref:PIN-like domain-containing protein n=1 Tax=Isoptericola sp. 178 TaxID=3064651 RepID=UPI002712E87A|nr:PIN-like domain-containing protein [Isoptericola sp. 178]MDO8144520.1 PIN-like domain-containing protein [Isoptericola sp. 178]